MKPNDVAYIDDGKVVGIVTGISEEGIQLEIKIGGTIKSKAQVRFTQGKHGNLSIITAADISDLSAISQMIFIDFLAIPFVNNGDDIAGIRKTLGEHGRTIHVLAKIDQLESV